MPWHLWPFQPCFDLLLQLVLPLVVPPPSSSTYPRFSLSRLLSPSHSPAFSPFLHLLCLFMLFSRCGASGEPLYHHDKGHL